MIFPLVGLGQLLPWVLNTSAIVCMGGSSLGVFLFNPGYAFIRFFTWRSERVLFAYRHFSKDENKKKWNEKQENNIAANHVHAAVADVKITCAFVACKTYFSAPILRWYRQVRTNWWGEEVIKCQHDTIYKWMRACVWQPRRPHAMYALRRYGYVHLFNFIYFELDLLKSQWIFNRWRRWRLCSERHARNVYKWCEAFDTSARLSRMEIIQDFHAVEVFVALDLHFLELNEFCCSFIGLMPSLNYPTLFKIFAPYYV